MISPLATFAVFVISAAATGTRLNTAQAFTALSLIGLLEDPLTMLLQSYTGIMSSLACYDRIQAYLESPSRYDHRLRMVGPDQDSTASKTSFTDGAVFDIELQRL